MAFVFPFLSVVYTSNLESMLNFYKGIGMAFAEEKHGNGPRHYASELGSSVFEIYPASDLKIPEAKSFGSTMLGFKVESIEKIIADLQKQDNKYSGLEKKDGTLIIKDPDGRIVYLKELH